MFSRRHPYLFFMLVSSAIFSGFIITLSLIISLGSKQNDFNFKEKVGIVEVSGVIISSKEIIEDLKRFREDDSIKAIVIRIDSPGGGVGPSQEIFREIKKTSKKKIIVASMGAVAASGGYYAAVAANKIVANPGTITGSIGVIMGYTNFQELFNKIGLYPVVVKSGKYKDMGSPMRKMSDEEKKLLQDFVNKIHHQFVRDSAKGRDMDIEQMANLADGRIYTGEEAKELGLIDTIGNFEDAIEMAGRMAGIEGKIKAVYPPEDKFSFLKDLAQSSLHQILSSLINQNFYTGYLYNQGGIEN